MTFRPREVKLLSLRQNRIQVILCRAPFSITRKDMKYLPHGKVPSFLLLLFFYALSLPPSLLCYPKYNDVPDVEVWYGSTDESVTLQKHLRCTSPSSLGGYGGREDPTH